MASGDQNSNPSAEATTVREGEQVEGTQPPAAQKGKGKRLLGEDPLTVAPSKKRRKESDHDVFVHHGRHFGRTICAMANVYGLITNGIERHSGRFKDYDDDDFTAAERRELRIFRSLRLMCLDIDEVLNDGDVADVIDMAKRIQKGADAARHEDTKSIKSAIVDWIVPKSGCQIRIHRASKTERGFNNELTGALLCPADFDWSDPKIKDDLLNNRLVPAGDQWPIFLYEGRHYDPDDPWRGLLKGDLLAKGFKHIFTSPTSVYDVTKSTKSGNARIHGMTSVTLASIAYVATQVRFSLMATNQFVRSDTVTASERFYTSLMTFLEDPDEAEEVDQLLRWWNELIFPSETSTTAVVSSKSALAKLLEKRKLKKQSVLTPLNASLPIVLDSNCSNTAYVS